MTISLRKLTTLVPAVLALAILLAQAPAFAGQQAMAPDGGKDADGHVVHSLGD